MFTNGVLLDQKKARILSSCLTWIRFHIGATTPEEYQKVHQVPKTVFRTVCRNIRRFNDIRKGKHVSVGIGIAINPDNFLYVAKLPYLAQDLGVDFFQAKLDLTCLKDRRYIQWWFDTVIPYFSKIKNGLKGIKLHVFSDPIIKKTDVIYCHAHHVITAITADGMVAFCKMRRHQKKTSIGNIFESSLEEIFRSQKHKIISNMIQPKTCGILRSFCPYRTTNEVIDELVNIKQTINPSHLDFF